MTARRYLILVGSCAALLAAILHAYALDPFLPPRISQPAMLVGTWSAQLGTMKHVITFRADRTFAGVCMVSGKVDDEYSGEWYLGEGDVLTWTYLKSKVIPANTTDKDRIMSIDAHSMSLLTSHRVVRNYEKITDQHK